MSKRKLLTSVFAVFMCIVLLSADFFASAAILAFETQYDYDEADVAWLTDLVIQEDMTTVEGIIKRAELIPVPEYPYTETPESFREDVDYFTALYNLDENIGRAGYLYFFEVLSSRDDLLAANVSDREVREYLESIGITYPDNADSDQRVMARALFVAISMGNYSDNFANGTDLEEVLVSYMATLTGMNTESLRDWLPDSASLSLDEYILAASKLTLWSNGYEVTAETGEDEVYRLIAEMTVKAQGISVESDLPFSELNLTYIAALLGEKYSVSIDSAKLGVAINSGTTAYYILQLMGKEHGLSIREDNASYEDAFYLVADHSGAFDVENGEFYADIFDYEVYLKNKCDSIWVYPTAYSTNSSVYTVTVTVNGVGITNNYYNEVALSPDAEKQELEIVVTAIGKGKTKECVYSVTVYQGEESASENDPSTEAGSEEHSYLSSDSLVSEVLSSLGLDSVLSSVIDHAYVSLPAGLSGIVSYIAPTFDGNIPGGIAGSEPSSDDEFFIAVLDEVGAVIDTEIQGIPGLDLSGDLLQPENAMITFE